MGVIQADELELSGEGNPVVGGYELLERLERGPLGESFLARRGRSGEPTAALTVLDAMPSQPRAADRLAQQVVLLKALEHPRVVRLLGSGTWGQRPYVITDLPPGASLAERRLAPAEAALCLAQAAEACAYLHERGVVHRDLRAGNLLLGPAGVTLRGFGVAHIVGSTLTSEGEGVGAVGAAAPEQLAGEPIDGKADVYALGLLLYRWLAERPAYSETHPARLLEAMGTPPPMPPAAPPELSRLTLRLLARDPMERPDAVEVARVLAEWAARRGAALPAWREPRIAAEASPNHAPGERRIGPYRILSSLGEGGMGTVFLAARDDGTQVALKLLLRARGEPRFAREIRLLAELGQSDGFVPLLDSGQSPYGPYLVMPALTGGTLAERLGEPWPVEEAVQLGVRLAEIVGRAHTQGVIHRDLKPSNILYDASGAALVSDLGLGKHVEESLRLSQSLSRTGELRGTPGYMAPEQVEDAKSAGPPADVFALGAILYECLTGQAVVTASDPLARVVATAQLRLTPVRVLRPEVSPWLAAVVERALALDPADRPPDGAALAALLERPAPSRPRAAVVLAGCVLCAVALLGARSLGGAASASATPAPTSDPLPVDVAPERTTLARPRSTLVGGREVPRRLRGLLSQPGARLTGWWGSFGARHGAWVTSVALSPDGRRCVSADADGLTLVWDAATGEELWAAPRAGKTFTEAAFSRDGTRVLLVEGPRLHVLDAVDGRLAATHTVLEEGELIALAPLPDGRVLLGGARGATLVWDWRRGGLVRALMSPGSYHDFVLDVAASADGRILVATQGTRCFVWKEGGDDPMPLPFRASSRSILCVAISPDGERLAAGTSGGEVFLWDRATAEFRGGIQAVIRVREGLRRCARALEFSGDGSLLFSSGDDHRVRCWDVATRAERFSLLGQPSSVRAIAPSPDGRALFSGNAEGFLQRWELKDRRACWESTAPVAHTQPVFDLHPLPGERLASAGADASVRLWDLRGGGQLSRLQLPSPGLAVDGGESEGRPLVIGTQSGAVLAASVPLGRAPRRVTALAAPVLRVGVIDAGRALTLEASGELRSLDLATGSARPVDWTEERRCRDFALAQGGRALWLPDPGQGTLGRVDLSRLGGAEPLRPLPLQAPEPVLLALGPREQRALLADSSGTLALVDLTRDVVRPWGQLAAQPQLTRLDQLDPADQLNQLVQRQPRFALGERFAATLGEGREVVVWTVPGGEEQARIDLSRCADAPTCLAFAPGDALLLGTARGIIVRLDLER
jgi:serine/threonine protein kinase/WD40 repeat protein